MSDAAEQWTSLSHQTLFFLDRSEIHSGVCYRCGVDDMFALRRFPCQMCRTRTTPIAQMSRGFAWKPTDLSENDFHQVADDTLFAVEARLDRGDLDASGIEVELSVGKSRTWPSLAISLKYVFELRMVFWRHHLVRKALGCWTNKLQIVSFGFHLL